MREIKFRAWDTQERKWFDPTYRAYEGKVEDLLIGLNGHLIKRESHQLSHESMFPNRYVLNQFTGLRDKNGKEIYEGDIVLITGVEEFSFDGHFEWNDMSIVRWDDTEFMFYLDCLNKRQVSIMEDGYYAVDTFLLRKWDAEEYDISYEVIGNIYESEVQP